MLLTPQATACACADRVWGHPTFRLLRTFGEIEIQELRVALAERTMVRVSFRAVERGEPARIARSCARETLIQSMGNHVDLYDRVNLIPFDKLTEFFRGNLS